MRVRNPRKKNTHRKPFGLQVGVINLTVASCVWALQIPIRQELAVRGSAIRWSGFIIGFLKRRLDRFCRLS
jgi:hypothetical protein